MQAVNVVGQNQKSFDQSVEDLIIKNQVKKETVIGRYQVSKFLGSVTKFKLVANKTNEDGFNVKEVKEK
jgi:hypothetical protein